MDSSETYNETTQEQASIDMPLPDNVIDTDTFNAGDGGNGPDFYGMKIHLTALDALEPFTDAIRQEGCYCFGMNEEDHKKVKGLFDTNKTFSRAVLKKVFPELDEKIQHDLRDNLIGCGMETFFRYYNCGVNIVELMQEDINEGIFKPENDIDEEIFDYDEDDAFCEIYNDGVINEWWTWEVYTHISNMPDNQIPEYIAIRYDEFNDEIFSLDLNYWFEFDTKPANA